MIEEALLKTGISVWFIAKECGIFYRIPYKLYEKEITLAICYKSHNKVISREEEDILKNYLIMAADLDFGLASN